MNYVAQATYLLLILLTGYAVLSAIHPQSRMRLVQLFALSGALGAGCVGLLLFWSSLAGFATSRGQLLLIGACVSAGLCLLWTKQRLIAPVFRLRAKVLLRVILIFYAFTTVALNSLANPLGEWDAFAIWALKAKVLLYSALNPAPAYFHDLSLSYSHLDYPLMVPFLTAGDFAATGGTNDRAAESISVFLDLLLVPMVYAGLRWKLKPFPSALLSAIYALLPAVCRYSGTGCADVPLAVFYAGNVIYSVRWIANPRWQYLFLAILFGTFTAFTKNEGLVLALICGGTMLLLGTRHGQGLQPFKRIFFFAGLLALDGAWLIWNRQLPRTHENYGSKLFSPALIEQMPRLKQILPALLVHAADPANWGLVCILITCAIALGWRAFRLRPVQAVWLIFGMQMASYIMVYIVTPWDLDTLLPTTADRLILQASPAVFLITGWHWAAVQNKLPAV